MEPGLRAKQTNQKSLFWLLQLVGWSAYGFFDSYLRYVDSGVLNTSFIIGNLTTYASGFLITILLRRLYLAYLSSQFKLSKLFLYIIVYVSSAAILWIIIDFSASIFLWGFDAMESYARSISFPNYVSMFVQNALLLFSWSGLYLGLRYIVQWQTEKDRAEIAELLANTSQLQMLRYQLNPHFLFNSLSSLRSLIREDPPRAEHMLGKISELLRYSLGKQSETEITLGRELEVIQNYFDIESIRFGDKLIISIQSDPLAEEYPIPAFLIHPLAENALKHGMDTSSMPLRIRITAEVEGKQLVVKIHNTGKWIEESTSADKDGRGMGLDNVRKRLAHYFPGRHQLVIAKGMDEVCVSLTVDSIKEFTE